VGSDISVIDAVLTTDIEREELLTESKALQVETRFDNSLF
jgi:hypothetical protein